MTKRQQEAKAYLDNYEDACRRIRQCDEQCQREDILNSEILTSFKNNDMLSLYMGDSFFETGLRWIADKRLSLIEAKAEALLLQSEIINKVVNLGGIERDILIEKYIMLKSWEEVSDAVNYSLSQTQRIHREALTKIAMELFFS